MKKNSTEIDWCVVWWRTIEEYSGRQGTDPSNREKQELEENEIKQSRRGRGKRYVATLRRHLSSYRMEVVRPMLWLLG
jgi:hypothetical protein